MAKPGGMPPGCCEGQKLKVQNPGPAELTPMVLWTKITEMDLPACLFDQMVALISIDTALYIFTTHSHSLSPLNLERACVATLQGQAGSWYSCRRKNIHRTVGMSGMPLFTGGQATQAASCVSACLMSWPLIPVWHLS